jgi:23S rRNA pseudouridine955/2504/2580 synthase
MTVQILIVSEDEAGMRLDRWFKRRLPTLSLAHLNKIVRTGQVRVDGARASAATRLAAGQKIRVPPVKTAPPAPKPAISEEDRRVLRAMILYEDDDLLVLNKPFGLAVQGGSGTTRHIDGMLASLADARGERPVLVHRLDRDTAGVLLVAKSRRIAAELGAIFRSRQAQKI